jgi:hypothetical protein
MSPGTPRAMYGRGDDDESNYSPVIWQGRLGSAAKGPGTSRGKTKSLSLPTRGTIPASPLYRQRSSAPLDLPRVPCSLGG